MRKLRNVITAGILVAAMALGAVGCQSGGGSSDDSSSEESVTLSIAAAASLEKCYTEKLIPMFEKEHSNVKIEGTPGFFLPVA